jgi:hypothetical protein
MYSAIAAAILIASIAGPRSANAADPDPQEAPTFAKDVAPILQENCQACHRPGSIGPMSLQTYEEVRPWARVIAQRVEARMMPPWHVDPTLGVQKFKNDISLTDEQIATIVAWVDAGAPMGDLADMPRAIEWPDERAWQLSNDLGQPDLVIRSDPYTVRPNGQDQWWTPLVETGLNEDRYIRAIELKPSYPLGARVTHHVVLYSVVGQRRGLLTEWAMGKVGEVMPTGTGRLIEAGTKIEWDVHYYPIGEAVPEDQVELAFWFHPRGYKPDFENQLVLYRSDPTEAGPRGATLDIPPHAIREIEAMHTFRTPVRIESFQPHMHLRGREMTIEAIYPDGRREIISHVDRFQHNWQISYKYAEDAMPLLPAGSVLVVRSLHDNTSDNPNNPDPNQWVGFGRRTVDEMAHAWVGVTYLDEAGYQRLLAEREEARRARGSN